MLPLDPRCAHARELGQQGVQLALVPHRVDRGDRAVPPGELELVPNEGLRARVEQVGVLCYYLLYSMTVLQIITTVVRMDNKEG